MLVVWLAKALCDVLSWMDWISGFAEGSRWFMMKSFVRGLRGRDCLWRFFLVVMMTMSVVGK